MKSGAEVKFHTGTSEVAAMFYPLHGSFMEGGDEGLMQVRTKTPVVAGPGDLKNTIIDKKYFCISKLHYLQLHNIHF